MKGIIWYAPGHKSAALKELEYITDKYKNLGIDVNSSRKNANNTFTTFINDDYWEIMSASGTCRGKCCNVSYVDRAIDPETFCVSVAPATKGFPYTAFHFYGEGELSYDII